MVKALRLDLNVYKVARLTRDEAVRITEGGEWQKEVYKNLNCR